MTTSVWHERVVTPERFLLLAEKIEESMRRETGAARVRKWSGTIRRSALEPYAEFKGRFNSTLYWVEQSDGGWFELELIGEKAEEPHYVFCTHGRSKRQAQSRARVYTIVPAVPWECATDDLISRVEEAKYAAEMLQEHVEWIEEQMHEDVGFNARSDVSDIVARISDFLEDVEFLAGRERRHGSW
jgi:hypothetical protein